MCTHWMLYVWLWFKTVFLKSWFDRQRINEAPTPFDLLGFNFSWLFQDPPLTTSTMGNQLQWSKVGFFTSSQMSEVMVIRFWYYMMEEMSQMFQEILMSPKRHVFLRCLEHFNHIIWTCAQEINVQQQEWTPEKMEGQTVFDIHVQITALTISLLAGCTRQIVAGRFGRFEGVTCLW